MPTPLIPQDSLVLASLYPSDSAVASNLGERILERRFVDTCRDDEDCPSGLFERYRNAIRIVSRFPAPEGLSALSNPEVYFTDHGTGHLERVEERTNELVQAAHV